MGRFVDTTCRISEFFRQGGHENGSYRTVSGYRRRASRNLWLSFSRQADPRAFRGIYHWADDSQSQKCLGNQSRIRPDHRLILSKPVDYRVRLGCLGTQSASAGVAATGTLDPLFKTRGYSRRQCAG